MTTANAAQPGPIKSGRPPKGDVTRKRFYDGKLYPVLLAAFPGCVEGGRLSPRMLADLIGVHKFTVYKWLNKDQLFPDPAKKLVAASDGRLKTEDLVQFVMA